QTGLISLQHHNGVALNDFGQVEGSNFIKKKTTRSVEEWLKMYVHPTGIRLFAARETEKAAGVATFRTTQLPLPINPYKKNDTAPSTTTPSNTTIAATSSQRGIPR